MNQEEKKLRINEIVGIIRSSRNEGNCRVAIDELTSIGEPNPEAVDAVLDFLQWWFNWGDHDKTYLAIIYCLGVIGLENQNAVNALERSMYGNTWPSSALENLQKLAQNGDSMAQSVLDKEENRDRFNKLK
jgi:hypothetical protein